MQTPVEFGALRLSCDPSFWPRNCHRLSANSFSITFAKGNNTTNTPWPAFIASIIPIVLGGVTTYFRIFLLPKDDFRHRIRLKRAELAERAAIKLSALLQHVRSLCPNDSLRGDGREVPDLVGEYTKESVQLFTMHQKLGALEGRVTHAYLTLYATIAIGIGGAISAWLLPFTHPWVLGISLVAIALQLWVILCVFLASWRLDEYEDIS